MIKAYAAPNATAQLEPFEYDPGPLTEDQVEIKVQHCGVCHSDVAMVDNNWGMSSYPLVPGHEVIGTINIVENQVRVSALAGTRATATTANLA